jgi:hypothetical protein
MLDHEVTSEIIHKLWVKVNVNPVLAEMPFEAPGFELLLAVP